MKKENNTIQLRVYEAENTNLISEDFIESLNNDSMAFFDKMGIEVKLLPPPGLGGGGDISLFLQICKIACSMVKSIMNNSAQKAVDSRAPRFWVYLFYRHTYDLDTIWEWMGDNETESILNQMVFQAHQLTEYLKKSYAGYQFGFKLGYDNPQFHYHLELDMPYNHTDVRAFSTIIRYIHSFQLKGFADEAINYLNGFFIKQNIQRMSKGEKVVSAKNIYTLKCTRGKRLSSRKRGIKEKKNPKGKTIGPIAW